MPFRCDRETLARLEWPALARHLAECCATARGADACGGDLFAQTPADAVERLAETDEARALLDAREAPSLAGIADLRPWLSDLELGRALPAAVLAAIAQTLEAAARLRASLCGRGDASPRLAQLAAALPELTDLAGYLRQLVTPEGEVRDDASPQLRGARRQARRLQAEIDQWMARLLRAPDVRAHLQDDFATLRDNRPVLPVRASERSRVRGIVHDVSSSGTTVFIEPEAVVDLGNRLRIAETEVEHELRRILREASDRVRAEAQGLDTLGAGLERVDVALARGRLSAQVGGLAPEICALPCMDLRGLRHPLLLLDAGLEPAQVVENDLHLPEGALGLLISGPNAGGKTVAAKAIGLAALALRAGMHVPCAPGSRIALPDAVFADIGDEQDLRSGLSTFSARMQNLARIVAASDPSALVVVDEVGEGTEPGEGAALAQALLESLVERGARVIATTHFNRLKELAGSDARFINASAEFDPESLRPTYRVHLGAPGSSGAMYAAQRMGMEASIIERARALLDGEDRKLEALTRDLSELRQDLEAERRSALEVRATSEALRADYEARLEGLRRGREAALEGMHEELEQAFRSAREELAQIMREVQRPGAAQGRGAGRAVNRAQRQLGEVRRRAPDPPPTPAAKSARPVDPEQLVAGARVELRGVAGEAAVVGPPDRRGRIEVRAAGARLRVPIERIERVLARVDPPSRLANVSVERAEGPELVTSRCDLRGLRVDEALDRAEAHLQSLMGRGGASCLFVHGHGTGALRSAIRSWLQTATGVRGIRAGAPAEGGNGVTVVDIEV